MPNKRPQSERIGIETNAVLELIEWLTGDECHALDEAGLAIGFGQRLIELGLPLNRLTLHLMTLHPEIVGRTVAWAPNELVEIHDRDAAAAVHFHETALYKAIHSRERLVVRRDDGHPMWTHLDVFADRGLVELILVPLYNGNGPVSLATFGTILQRGFTPAERKTIERLVPALRNACELRTLRQIELSLLDTYVGPMTARRILAGKIHKGEIETLEAALMLCDLRGFTELSNRLEDERVLELLNAYFDGVVPTITREGGEVLKFMGDAVLAFFPGYNVTQTCRATFKVAVEILDYVNKMRFPDARLQAGIALHYGSVSYGNIGSRRRLDFTLIGRDVNLLGRIQGACSELGEPLLMSRKFGDAIGLPGIVSIGETKLKGFEAPVELFRPA